MTKLKAALVALSLLLCTSVQSSEAIPFDAVRHLFAAMSAFDYDRMRATVTDDFQLLEDGEVWDVETLISAIRPGAGSYVRRNFFSPIRVEKSGDFVWVSYWNRATFAAEEETRERIWLESVVLVMDQGRWKIQLMHSTRVPDERLPAGIEFKEYVE